VGWQDRDWARLSDDELETLYGVERGRSFPTRTVVWTALAVVTAAVAAFGWTQREHAPPPVPAAPEVVYGDALGPVNACTEYELDTAGSWHCIVISQNAPGTRIARAAPYDGPCAHLRADQADGRWTCVSARAVAPPAPSPPSF
jgi:hypothetical protein